MRQLLIQSKKAHEIIDITDLVNNFIAENERKQGICFLNVLHTTVALTIADLDPGTDLDFLDAIYAMMPKLVYRHEHNPAPQHVGAHLMSAIIGTTLTMPFEQRTLLLGTWQRVILIELDGPKDRIIITNNFFLN